MGDNKRNSIVDLKNMSPNNINLQNKCSDLNKKVNNTEANVGNDNKNYKKQSSIISILDNDNEDNTKLMSQNMISYLELQQRMEKILQNKQKVLVNVEGFKAVDFHLNKKLMFDCDCFNNTEKKGYFSNYKVGVLEEFLNISHRELQSLLLVLSKLNDLIKGAEEAYASAIKLNQPNTNFAFKNGKDSSPNEHNSIKNAIKPGLHLSNRNVQKRDNVVKARYTPNRAIISVSRDSQR